MLEQKPEHTKQSNLDIALKLAKEEFAKRESEDMAEKAGGEYEAVNCSNSMVSVRLLGEELTLAHPDGSIEFPDHHQVPIVAHILLLHYLINATGKPLTGEFASYKDIPGGDKYFSVFKKRVEMPVINAYGENQEGFEAACSSLGGARVNMGDVAFRFQAFPMVPITYVFWRGEEEFPASLQVLFDGSVKDYLPLEDIVFLAEMLSWKLARYNT